MKIIVDDKIPYIKEAVRQITDDVIFVSGKEFTPKLICDADVLIVRTRTDCNRKLLEGSRIQLIVTATAGCDHIDVEYCQQTGIAWSHAAGCNSSSVAQYVQSSLLVLQQTRKIALE
jgi:erythronate-4-phosphate dehydrogenase